MRQCTLSFSWNSSSDANVGSMTRTTCANQCIERLQSFEWYFYSRIYRPTNSPLKTVYFYRIISLHYIMYMFEHRFTHVFKKSARLDMFRVYHRARFITVPIRIRLSNTISMTRQRSPYLTPTCMNFPQIPSDFRTTRYMRSIIVYYRLISHVFDMTLLLQ